MGSSFPLIAAAYSAHCLTAAGWKFLPNPSLLAYDGLGASKRWVCKHCGLGFVSRPQPSLKINIHAETSHGKLKKNFQLAAYSTDNCTMTESRYKIEGPKGLYRWTELRKFFHLTLQTMTYITEHNCWFGMVKSKSKALLYKPLGSQFLTSNVDNHLIVLGLFNNWEHPLKGTSTCYIFLYTPFLTDFWIIIRRR